MSHYPKLKKPERTRIAKKWKRDTRQDKNGNTNFMSLGRMSRAKWEKSVMESMIKREGLRNFPTHYHCRCGSPECLAAGGSEQQKSTVHGIPKKVKKNKVQIAPRFCVHFAGLAT